MITRIEASQYRCLQTVNQSLKAFEILVGPNASGKSTFLDVVAFLRTLVSEGLDAAIAERTENFHALVWGREGSQFGLAIEAQIPEGRRVSPALDTIRYEVGVRIDPRTETIVLGKENVIVRPSESIHWGPVIEVVKRGPKLVDFKYEGEPNKGHSFELHRNFTGLANLPVDESKFPAAVWFKDLLREGIQTVTLDPEELRRASPPYQGKVKHFNGSNLAPSVPI